ncbi:hypothetical protein GTO89_03040 [Heliobacterium gestii]|uniref:Accessory gene regulator B n=1 Tax=Heliomicrobium gestii TaxID=2699 RepID=A0A845LAQ3_HELGE|nr:accessory gene regulator B family protein [Heliomicrobium gestii]MBM7865764.1 accessory gene regulator B [Heliomicrobium gestii]MZP42010.1 hypothetical protein [Heliomicrobium gestii]
MKKIAAKMGSWLAIESGYTTREQILSYGLEYIIGLTINIGSIVVLAYFFNVIGEAVSFLITFNLLRLFSGGTHSINFWYCTLTGMVSVIGFSILSIQSQWIYQSIPISVLVVSIITVIMFLYAPSSVVFKEEGGKTRFRILRIGSLLFSVIWFLFINISTFSPNIVQASAYGLIWQAVSITPFGFSLIKKIDNILNSLRGGEK